LRGGGQRDETREAVKEERRWQLCLGGESVEEERRWKPQWRRTD